MPGLQEAVWLRRPAQKGPSVLSRTMLPEITATMESNVGYMLGSRVVWYDMFDRLIGPCFCSCSPAVVLVCLLRPSHTNPSQRALLGAPTYPVIRVMWREFRTCSCSFSGYVWRVYVNMSARGLYFDRCCLAAADGPRRNPSWMN